MELVRKLGKDPRLDIGPPDEDRSSGAHRRGEIIAVVKVREIALHLEQRGFKDLIALRLVFSSRSRQFETSRNVDY